MALENHYNARSFQILVDTVEDYAIFFLDPDGLVATWNKGAQRLKGYTAQEIVGRHFSAFYSPEDAASGRPAGLLQIASRDGRVEDEGYRFRKDGSRFWGSVIITPAHDDSGALIGYAKITRDMTARKLAEDRQRQAHEEMERAKIAAELANQTKTQFLANMSHEIRTPLNGIIGVAELLRTTTLDAHQRDLLDTIRFSGDNLLTVLNDILDYSKIEHGKLELDFHSFNLLNLLDEVIGLFYYRAREKNLDLAYHVSPQLPLDLIGDGLRIRQVLINLVSNAIKFTEAGRVVIEIAESTETIADAASVGVTFCVRDTGIGVPLERQAQLFVPFSQVDATTARRYGGSGLGLAICQRLVALMGGQISVESQLGQGSAFAYCIPLRCGVGHTTLSQESQLFAGKRALIVDDIATNRNLIRLLLQRWGAVTVEVPGPEEALEVLRQGGTFDVALVDYHMPDGDGFALARRIADLALPTPLPLVLVSSYTGEYPEAQLRQVGFVAAIAKPLRQNILRSTLQEILSVQKSARPPAFHPDDAPFEIDRPASILVVEDNAVNRKVILHMLKRFGLTADIAGDGEAAIDAVSGKNYDLLLMDVHMPGMDGLEATRVLRQTMPKGERPYIVALTADTTVAERDVCLAAGMDGYLTKPLTLATLRRTLETYVR